MKNAVLIELLIVIILVVPHSDCQEVVISPEGPVYKASGSTIYFVCELQGIPDDSAAPYIQWRRENGEIIEDTNGRVFIEDETMFRKKLYIRYLSHMDIGTYTCDAFHHGETYDQHVTVGFFEDITFMETPTRYVVREDEEIMLPCTANGIPQPTISWRFNRVRVPENNDKYMYLESGLVIKRLEPSDTGSYDCRAEVVSQGNLKIRHVYLDIQFPPSIVQPPNSTAALYGSDVTLHCFAKGNPAVFYEWKKEVYNDAFTRSKVTIGRGTNMTSLLIRDVGKTDIGRYICEASNPIGVETAFAEITRLIRPHVTHLPNRVQQSGDVMVLTCTVSGEPVPDIQWHKVGNPYPYWEGPQRSDPRIRVEEVDPNISRLMINAITMMDSGTYTCTATSPAGTDSKNGSLAVEFPPRMQAMENHALAWGGQTRTFNCTATGVPFPTITWYRNNEFVVANGTYTILGQKGTSLLQINILENERWLFGDYKCVAKNHHDIAQLIYTLEQARHPGQPRNVSLLKQTSTEVTLGASAPRRTGGLPITQWMVRYSESTDKSGKNLRPLFYGNGELMRVPGLTEGTRYNFYLSAGNAVGFSKPVHFRVETPLQNHVPSIRIGITEHPLSSTHSGQSSNQTGLQLKPPGVGDKRAEVLRAKSTSEQESSGINMIIIAAAGGIGVLLLVVCIVGGVMCKRRSKRTTSDGPNHTVLYQKKNGPEMKIVHMNGQGDKLHIEIPRNQKGCTGSPVANVQQQTATLSRRSPQPPRRVMNGQSNGGASILAVVEGDSSLPGGMYQNNRDSVDSTGAIDCMSNLNTLQRQAWEEMIHDSATVAPDSAAGEAPAMPDQVMYRPRVQQNDYSGDPAALPPPPPFLLSGNLPHDGAVYSEVLDGYHSEENIDDDIEPIRASTQLNLRSPAQQQHCQQLNQQQQLLHHQQNVINQHRQQQHINEERIPLNHGGHVMYT